MSSTALTTTAAGSALRTFTSNTPSAQQSRPSTTRPAPQTPQQTSKSTPQPGTWRHPRMDEIARRQNAAVFNGDNINRIAIQGGLLLLTFGVPSYIYSWTPSFITHQFAPLEQFKLYPMLAIRLYLLFSIVMAFKPLFGPKDEMNDIPLTPSQRALLGLQPSDAPQTPGEHYLTPPRYSRSTTPKSNASDRAGSRSPYSGSPLTSRERSGSMDRSMGAGRRGGSGSPYSDRPLVQKALGGSAGRRLSFDSGSGSSGLPSTPTPVVGAGRASVGLNNKWLYERGRSSPSSRGLFS